MAEDNEEEESREVFGLLASAGKAEEVQEMLIKTASLKGASPDLQDEEEGGENV